MQKPTNQTIDSTKESFEIYENNDLDEFFENRVAMQDTFDTGVNVNEIDPIRAEQESIYEENENFGFHHQKRNNSNDSIVNCFVILNQPIERMLIRYEKIPKDFFCCYKYEEEWRKKNCPSSYAHLNMFQTLSRFLYHKRFIWSTNDPNNLALTSNLTMYSVAKILKVLTLYV